MKRADTVSRDPNKLFCPEGGKLMKIIHKPISVLLAIIMVVVMFYSSLSTRAIIAEPFCLSHLFQRS